MAKAKKNANLPARTTKKKPPATTELSADELAAAEYAGAGMETVGANDLLIPRLAVVQKTSPQLDKTSALYIDGAEEGDVCNTGTGKLYDQVDFIPVIYRKQWIEWAEPRGSGRIVQIYNSQSILDECTRDKDGPPRLPSGNAIIETAQFSGFLFEDDGYSKTFIAMAGSQLRKSRRWLNLSTSEKIRHPESGPITAPLFWRCYTLGTQPEKNAKGSWIGWTIARAATMSEKCKDAKLGFSDVMDDALLFAKAISDGHERLNLASTEDADEDAM